MASSSKPKPPRNRKQKNGKKTMKLKEWYPEWEQDVEFRYRPPIDRLPPEVISMILMKLDIVDILCNAQLVCASWYEICKDPFMWKSIDKINISRSGISEYGVNFKICSHVLIYHNIKFEKITKHVIDRCCGQLIEVNIKGCLLPYIADRCPQLTCLRLWELDNTLFERVFCESILKLPMLTEIDISCNISEKVIEVIGRSCPLLKSFKVYCGYYFGYEKEALAITTNMPGLHHLALFGNKLTNVGLQAILDGCSLLVSLDLRQRGSINLAPDLQKRCREQIKDLHLRWECGFSGYSDIDEFYDDYLCCCGKNINDNIDYYDIYKIDDDDDDDFSRSSGYYNGYLNDEYEEIVSSRKFIESSLLLL